MIYIGKSDLKYYQHSIFRVALLIATSLSFSSYLFAQVPTPPPGYDQGPYNTDVSTESLKGEFIIRITKRLTKKARKQFKRKRGKTK